jgi:putative membrane protein
MISKDVSDSGYLVTLHKIFLGAGSVVAILLAITLLLRVPGARLGDRKKSAMNEEPTHKQSTARLDTSTQLAYVRTYLAHERTLMGWCERPVAHFIQFTIAKVLVVKHEEATFLGPRAIGIIMIGMGLVALALATMQHRRALRAMHERCPELPPSLAGVMAAFFALLGILALFSVILRMR